METLEFRWRCRDGVALAPGPAGTLQVHVDGHAPIGVGVRLELVAYLLRLNHGVAEERIADVDGGAVSIAAGFDLLGRLCRRGLLVVEVHGPRGRLVTLRPVAAGFALPGPAAVPPDPSEGWRLSRFAMLRREEEGWILEGTEASCDVAFHDPSVLLWLHEAAVSPPGPETVRGKLLALLAVLGFLEGAEEAECGSRQTWEFHDRLFHVRSRSGGLRPFGATFRFGDGTGDGGALGLPCPPVLRAPHAGETLALPAPAPRARASLADVMDRRRSLRSMGDPPVGLADVAALLHRVARATNHTPGGFIRRSYPSGGAMHELEFYLAVRECRGLEAGFYHYRSDAQALTRLVEGDAAAASMIDDCARAWGQPDGPPQCLAVISSRLPRVAWKYEGLAYRLSLLNAGAALQSFHLVATDLGLNGCAAGGGRPELFARATGESTWTETSIGEFGFGSAPARA